MVSALGCDCLCAPTRDSRDSAPLGPHLQAAAARALPAACSESAAVCAVRLQLWLLAWSGLGRCLPGRASLRLAAAAAALAAPRKARLGWAGLGWAGLGWAGLGWAASTEVKSIGLGLLRGASIREGDVFFGGTSSK